MDQEREPTGEGAPAGMVERRRSPRVQVSLDARWRRLGRSETPEETTTVDVSHGGARITVPAHVAIGDVIQLVVQMPHGIELALQGLVVQVTDGDVGTQAHVAFDSLSTTAADLLTELLDAHGSTGSAGEPPGESPRSPDAGTALS